jgi:hypothetical protein
MKISKEQRLKWIVNCWKSDLKVYKKIISDFKKGKFVNTLELIDALISKEQIEFMLNRVLTGKIYQYPDGTYDL